jgi:hypothetical protein
MGTGYIYPGVSGRGQKLTTPINTYVKNECGYSATRFSPPPSAFMAYTGGILARKINLKVIILKLTTPSLLFVPTKRT